MTPDEERGQRKGPSQPVSAGIDYSISPGVPCPETVLVAVMTDGGYLLIGRTPEMPLAFVAARDAGPLRHALQQAYNNLTGDPAHGVAGAQQ